MPMIEIHQCKRKITCSLRESLYILRIFLQNKSYLNEINEKNTNNQMIVESITYYFFSYNIIKNKTGTNNRWKN
jgi:hypothetical protein